MSERLRDQEIEPWETHEGCTCVECPDCAFLFDDGHTDAAADAVRYSCPACAESALAARLAAVETELKQERAAKRPLNHEGCLPTCQVRVSGVHTDGCSAFGES